MRKQIMTESQVVEIAKDFLSKFGSEAATYVFSSCRFFDDDYEHHRLRSKWIVFFDIADETVLASSIGARVYVSDIDGTASFRATGEDNQ